MMALIHHITPLKGHTTHGLVSNIGRIEMSANKKKKKNPLQIHTGSSRARGDIKRKAPTQRKKSTTKRVKKQPKPKPKSVATQPRVKKDVKKKAAIKKKQSTPSKGKKTVNTHSRLKARW